MKKRGMNTIIVEKDREVGGFYKYDEYPVNNVRGRDLISQFAINDNIMCNMAAFSYDKDGVWVASREGSRKIHGTVIAANGFREKTVLELGIYGFRPSGVFYLYSAWELINKGYSIGDKVIIYGFNHYSISLASKLSKTCEKVVITYTRGSLIHSLEEVTDMGVEVLKGRVKKVLGSERVSSVMIDGRELIADTLILAELSPWNQLGVENIVGNAAMILEDPMKIVEASRIIAESLIEGGDPIEVLCSVPHIPHKVSKRVARIILGVGMGVKLKVNGEKIVVDEPYPVVELPSNSRVTIEVL
ncbi:MAG: hypothetical protein LZ168_07070 [Thaumarchaeota archaeon]|nr:hypothetical protein [Candidatus Geocrenenecus arthurdayi]